jgi:dihydropyrimidinase
VLGQELPALVEDGYTSLKVFMTYENLRLRDDEILATLDSARRTGALVMVHCENEDAIRYLIGRHEEEGKFAPKFHALSRPVAAEREATHRALSLAEIVGCADRHRSRFQPAGDGRNRACPPTRPARLPAKPARNICC